MAGQNQGANMDQFESYFKRADLDQDGRISGAKAIAFFQGSGLNKQVLAQVMEIDKTVNDHNQEEEYVLLDLDAVCSQVDIPPDEPYTLSGLDTLNPVLTIGNKLKLIGEYEETIGTCLIFSENEKPPSNREAGSTEASHSKNDCTLDPNPIPSKHIRPVTSLHKILRFRLLSETDEHDLTGKPLNPLAQEDDPTKVN